MAIYGAWHCGMKKFCFGIKESSQKAAREKLYEKIGKSAYKWTWQTRRIDATAKQRKQRERNEK